MYLSVRAFVPFIMKMIFTVPLLYFRCRQQCHISRVQNITSSHPLQFRFLPLFVFLLFVFDFLLLFDASLSSWSHSPLAYFSACLFFVSFVFLYKIYWISCSSWVGRIVDQHLFVCVFLSPSADSLSLSHLSLKCCACCLSPLLFRITFYYYFFSTNFKPFLKWSSDLCELLSDV